MPSPRTLIFGQFRLIPSQRLLQHGEAPLSIGSRALDVLIALVEQAGSTMSKEQLLAAAWPNTSVHEANLRVHIGGIRKLLGDGRAGYRFIVNEAGRGYRFVAPVALSDEPTRLDSEPSSGDRLPVAAEKTRANLTAILGRSQIIDALAEQLPNKRLITIVGAGGIGKTTVALAVAERFGRSSKDKACFVDLAPLTDPTLVYSQLISALGIIGRSDNQIAGVVSFLRDKQMLIVFDNCERVIDAVTPLAEGIIRGARHTQVLTTSREPLRAQGEWIQRLAPLTLPDPATKLTAAEALTFPAIQMFMERAAASLDGFELSDSDAPVVADICRKLDGLPLAIELAASRVNAFGLSGLAALLNQRVHLPSLGRRTAAPRHRTIAAMLDWSYETLPDPESVILRRLAIFAGAFTLDSASVVAADSEMDASSVVNCVANLVEKSLVAADLSGANAQYRLLDTTRAYALQKLRESDEFEPLARRHAEYFRTLFERAEVEREKEPAEWLAAYRHEIDNVRSALDWAFSQTGDAALGVAVTLAAIPLWTHLSLNEETYLRVQMALQKLDPSAVAAARARMRLFAALAPASLFMKGASPEVHAAWSNVLSLAERLGDTDFQLRALWGLLTENLYLGHFPAALEYAQRFASLAANSSTRSDALIGERIIGLMRHYLGDQEEARRHTERALAHDASPSSLIPRFRFDQRAAARSCLSNITWLEGFPDQAMRMVESIIDEANELGHVQSMNYVSARSACMIALYNGDLSSADRFIRMQLDRVRHQGSLNWKAWARGFEGVLLIKRRDLKAGMSILSAALDDLGANAFHMHYVAFLGDFAEALSCDGQVERALTTIEKALDLCRRNEELWCLPELLRVRGEISLKARAPKDAEGYFHQALDWARRQKVLSWELRGATSLARLQQAQGRSGEAHALLSAVYGRFTEGFGTSDLGSAKSLLDELT